MSELKLRVLQIVPGTSVDGPGLRTSVYLAGCSHACGGCHNPASWSFAGGEEMTVESLVDIIDSHGFNVTLTGGDPLQHPDISAVEALVDALVDLGYKVWCYTGYNCDELDALPALKRLLPKFDAIVEGPFIMSRRTTSLPFRGSDNQRIVRKTASGWATIG